MYKYVAYFVDQTTFQRQDNNISITAEQFINYQLRYKAMYYNLDFSFQYRKSFGFGL